MSERDINLHSTTHPACPSVVNFSFRKYFTWVGFLCDDSFASECPDHVSRFRNYCSHDFCFRGVRTSARGVVREQIRF